MTARRTNVYVAPRPMRVLTIPGLCRLCGDPAWQADTEGPVHVCCISWAAELTEGRPCLSCASARAANGKWAQRQAIDAKRRRRT